MTPSLRALSDDVLLSETRRLVLCDMAVTADLLLYLAEVDDRKLHLGKAHPSLFSYCVEELGFSEDAAYQRIAVARLGRRFPAVLEAVRSGKVHLTGLRILGPHLTDDNHLALLKEASHKSKRQVEEMVARLAPKPPVPDSIRKLPSAPGVTASASTPSESLFPVVGSGTDRPAPTPASASLTASSNSADERPVAPPPLAPVRPAVVAPLSEETFKVQFTASRKLRNKLEEAKALSGRGASDLSSLLEEALDLLIAAKKKKRFGVGAKPRATARKERNTQRPPDSEKETASRHVPIAIRRAVYARDNGCCTFVDERGKRCSETRHLELDHIDGFARTHTHSVEGLRLRCFPHNQYAADLLYGRKWMDNARAGGRHDAPQHAPARITSPSLFDSR